MLYFLILVSLTVTVISASFLKSMESGSECGFIKKKLVGNELAPLIWASAALLLILTGIATSETGPDLRKKTLLQHELDVQRGLGLVMAKKMAKTISNQTNALIIDKNLSEKSKLYHEAFIDGFNKGKSKKIAKVSEEFVQLAKNSGNFEGSSSEDLSISAETIDEIVEKHPDSSLIISLIGIPNNFEISRTWRKASAEEVFIGLVTDDPFVLGGMISNGEIRTCIVPKKIYQYEEISANNDDLERIFGNRYLCIDADNIISTMRKNRRFFRVTRRF